MYENISKILCYLKPELSGLNGNAFLAALGQLFYSMSLAMGIMITYGSAFLYGIWNQSVIMTPEAAAMDFLTSHCNSLC